MFNNPKRLAIFASMAEKPARSLRTVDPSEVEFALAAEGRKGACPPVQHPKSNSATGFMEMVPGDTKLILLAIKYA